MAGKTLLVKFGNSTSLHGASRILLTKSRIRRSIWLLVFSSAWIAFGWNMYLVVGRYFSYPIRVELSTVSSGVPLSSITVCNHRNFDPYFVHRMKEFNVTAFYLKPNIL